MSNYADLNCSNLLISQEGAVVTITINRPDKLNALNSETIQQLGRAFAAVKADPSARCAVLTGSGAKSFVAGADISEFASLAPTVAREFSLIGQRVFRAIETLGKPVIAAINGFCFGGGMELAMACHLRIAADNAKFGQPEINLGIMPGFGGTQRLPRLVGRSASLELCLTGAQISAERAYQLGVVSKVVPAAELIAAANAQANSFAQAAPIALRAIIDAIVYGEDMPLDQGLDYESQYFGLLTSTDDMKEGAQAFLQKRKAEFKGS
jgi:enoyl-CoA hydratase